MTVSALMACYNRKEYVEKAVESIEKQLSEADELLISDDCSTDGTSEFIDALSEKYKNIKVFHQSENLGVDKNMTFLFDNAKNDIFIICDSDDISLDGRVETITKELEENNKISVIYSNGEVIDETGKIVSNDFFKSFKQKDSLINQLIHTTYFGTFFAFKKDFYIRIRSKFLSNQKEPWDRRIGFIAKRNNEICFLNKKLVKYRRWTGNVSAKKKTSFINKVKNRFNWLKLYLSAKVK